MAFESLRQSLRPGSNQQGDVRFQFGTEYSSNFNPPPPEEYNYKPLPAVYQPESTKGVGRHLAAKTGIFPRLHASLEEVKLKLAPVHTELTASLKRLDVPGNGFVNMEAFSTALHETGVFLSKADIAELAGSAPRNVAGDLDYVNLLDAIVGKRAAASTSSSMTSSLPQTFTWTGDAPLSVSLKLHRTVQPYQVSAANMNAFAQALTDIRSREQDPQKVAALMRHELLQRLLITPGPALNPDLSFRQWLMHNGVMARGDTTGPGVVPEEVYGVLQQIMCALGLPVLHGTSQLNASGTHLSHTDLTANKDNQSDMITICTSGYGAEWAIPANH